MYWSYNCVQEARPSIVVMPVSVLSRALCSGLFEVLSRGHLWPHSQVLVPAAQEVSRCICLDNAAGSDLPAADQRPCNETGLKGRRRRHQGPPIF